MFWAHYDDDLVFANPTLLHALDSGRRAHSCFFTASDAGAGLSGYADGRENGIRAAYDTMRGETGPWSDRSVVLPNGVTLTLTRPDGDDRISLSFLRLPDGGLRGVGYAATGWQSLAKLVTGELSSISTLDTGQALTLDLLRSTVAQLVVDYDATMVISHHPGSVRPPGRRSSRSRERRSRRRARPSRPVWSRVRRFSSRSDIRPRSAPRTSIRRSSPESWPRSPRTRPTTPSSLAKRCTSTCSFAVSANGCSASTWCLTASMLCSPLTRSMPPCPTPHPRRSRNPNRRSSSMW